MTGRIWQNHSLDVVDIPGTGTNQPIFLTDLAANRSENVTLADLRLTRRSPPAPAAG